MNVVVGLDTSSAAAEALRWAASYARAVGADLLAVHAYLWRDRETVLLPADPTDLDTSGQHPRAVQPPEEISRLFASVQPEPGWTLKCFAGDPGPVLRSQAKDAELLVVGTGEHVGLGRLLVGSVSHQCLTHATCPVVAVPAPHLIAKAGLNADPGGRRLASRALDGPGAIHGASIGNRRARSPVWHWCAALGGRPRSTKAVLTSSRVATSDTGRSWCSP